jgi:hypothetical protein
MLLSTSGQLARWFEAAFLFQKTHFADGARSPRALPLSSTRRAAAMSASRLSASDADAVGSSSCFSFFTRAAEPELDFG